MKIVDKCKYAFCALAIWPIIWYILSELGLDMGFSYIFIKGIIIGYISCLFLTNPNN